MNVERQDGHRRRQGNNNDRYAVVQTYTAHAMRQETSTDLNTRPHCFSYAICIRWAYTTPDSAVSYINRAQIAQSMPLFALWRMPADESILKLKIRPVERGVCPIATLYSLVKTFTAGL